MNELKFYPMDIMDKGNFSSKVRRVGKFRMMDNLYDNMRDFMEFESLAAPVLTPKVKSESLWFPRLCIVLCLMLILIIAIGVVHGFIPQ